MKHQDFLSFVTDKMTEIVETARAGQKEYAHGERDEVFNNFLRQSEELDLHPMKALWIYAMKHKDGVAAWLKGHRSQREPVQGRIKDLIVYMLLLWAWTEHEEVDPNDVL